MRQQARALGEDRVQLVLDKGPEALAHEDLRQPRVARLLEAQHQQFLHLRQDLGIEVALLDAGGVAEHDAVHPQRRRRRQDAAQRLGPRNGQQQIDAGPRGRRIEQLAAQHQLVLGEAQDEAFAEPSAQPPDPQDVSRCRPQHLAGVQQPAPAQARGPVGEEVLVAQEEQIHCGRRPSLFFAARAILLRPFANPSRSRRPCARTSGEACSEKWKPAW